MFLMNMITSDKYFLNKIVEQGPTEIWTRIAGFRVLSANHYTMGPYKIHVERLNSDQPDLSSSILRTTWHYETLETTYRITCTVLQKTGRVCKVMSRFSVARLDILQHKIKNVFERNSFSCAYTFNLHWGQHVTASLVVSLLSLLGQGLDLNLIYKVSRMRLEPVIL